MKIHDAVNFAAIIMAQLAELQHFGKGLTAELRESAISLLNALATAPKDEYARCRHLAEALQTWGLELLKLEKLDVTGVTESGAGHLVDPKLHAAVLSPKFWESLRRQVRAACASPEGKVFDAYRKALSPKLKEPATPPKAPPPAPTDKPQPAPSKK